MPSHRAAQIPAANEALQLADVETASPPAGHVRLDVAACGICGTDQAFAAGAFPGMSWPLTLGHEIAGTVAEVGDGVDRVTVGDRVAVGWFGGCDFTCAQCRRGAFIHCENGQVPSWQYPGGYAESVVVPAEAAARIPDELSFVEAAPMGCAGVTTYNGLRSTGAVAGDLVAVLGVGGLGHLGIQFARAMGFETVAVSRGADKADDARELGAHHYVDSSAADPAQALQDLGGAAVVLCTAGNSEAMGSLIGGLRPEGRMVVLGVTPDPLPISPMQLITPALTVAGHPSGTASDTEDTMAFAVQSGVRPWTQTRPLAEAAQAWDEATGGSVRYRMVLTT